MIANTSKTATEVTVITGLPPLCVSTIKALAESDAFAFALLSVIVQQFIVMDNDDLDYLIILI